MKQEMSNAEILSRFGEIVAKSLRIEPALVTAEATLDELGAESLDLIEITMECEDVFEIWISEKSILQTAKDVFGEGVLEKDGFLTDEGKALLRDRMPEIDPATLKGPVAVQELNKTFLRVGIWVTMIENLRQFTPSACKQCGGELGKAAAFRKKCVSCGGEEPLVSGEELNKKWVAEYRDRVMGPQAPEELLGGSAVVE